MAEDLVSAIAELEEEEALRLVEARLAAGYDPFKILEESRRAMEIVGRRFAGKEYFIPDLIYAGEILSEISVMVKPHLGQNIEVERSDKVIIGTVAGDVHDIGKNIVTFMLDINGFEVYDLGIDIPPETFIEKIRDTGAEIVGLSGFLTLAYDSMKNTIDAIREAGLRDRVKLMIGGGQMDDGVRKYTGADAYGRDAAEAVSLAKGWAGIKLP